MSSLFSGPDIPKPPAPPPPPSSVDVGNTGAARAQRQQVTGGGSTIATGPTPSQRQDQFASGVEESRRKRRTETLG
jgi:hypothetical protein